jgi:hypothetical protein
MPGRLHPTFTAPPDNTADTRSTTAATAGAVIANSTGPSNRCRAESVTDNTAVFYPASTATTVAAITSAPLIDITTSAGRGEDRRAKRHILEGIGWIPSDTSGGVWEED